MRTYDLVFGLGNVCSCTQSLRRAGLQHLSFPYDWITSVLPEHFSHDVQTRAETIVKGFPDWFNREDFVFHGPNTNGKDKYYNRKLDLIFVHDFPIGVPLDQSFPGILAKYRRRIDRFLALLREARRVLVVRVDNPGAPQATSPDDCRQARRVLAAGFPDVSFDFLLFQPDESADERAPRLDEVEPGLLRVAFDYRNHQPGADPTQPDFSGIVRFLVSRYAVRDYRTPEEIAAYELRQKRARWARLGAATAAEYHWKRFSLPVRQAFATCLSPLLARLRRTRYDQIVPLGVNCETAFRFFCRWGFVDSSLFAWAQSRNLSTVTAALTHFDDILAGDVTQNASDKLWLCARTGIRFHGKLKAAPGLAPSPEALEADLADLRGRIAHLKEKFLASLRNDRPTLLVHRLAAADTSAPGLGDRLDALEAALRGLGARNCRLLVVCERKDLDHMPAGPGRLFRAVRAFNPGSDIANARRGDPRGWNAIFTEFAPTRILAKAHDFKFE